MHRRLPIPKVFGKTLRDGFRQNRTKKEGEETSNDAVVSDAHGVETQLKEESNTSSISKARKGSDGNWRDNKITQDLDNSDVAIVDERKHSVRSEQVPSGGRGIFSRSRRGGRGDSRGQRRGPPAIPFEAFQPSDKATTD